MVGKRLRFLVVVAAVMAGGRWLFAHRRGDAGVVVSDLRTASRFGCRRSHAGRPGPVGVGPLERRLDLPHVHVMAEDHVVLLHGEGRGRRGCGRDRECRAPRVRCRGSGVVSPCRPTARRHSAVARSGGAAAAIGGRAQALLGAAAESGSWRGARLRSGPGDLVGVRRSDPGGRRAQLLAHLPHDVREMVTPPRYLGRASRRPRTMHELFSNVFTETDAPLRHAQLVVQAVLYQLRRLVPRRPPMWRLSCRKNCGRVDGCA